MPIQVMLIILGVSLFFTFLYDIGFFWDEVEVEYEVNDEENF